MVLSGLAVTDSREQLRELDVARIAGAITSTEYGAKTSSGYDGSPFFNLPDFFSKQTPDMTH